MDPSQWPNLFVSFAIVSLILAFLVPPYWKRKERQCGVSQKKGNSIQFTRMITYTKYTLKLIPNNRIYINS